MNIYLHFEDWSEFLWMLESSTLPVGSNIIKVFATDKDPRVIFGKPNIFCIEESGDDFNNTDRFQFSNGSIFFGYNLENFLTAKRLSEEGKSLCRALYRFSLKNGFTNSAMCAKENGVSIISNPMEVIDWKSYPKLSYLYLHLDIFFEESLKKLITIVDYKNQELMVNNMAGSRWRGKQK